jgi:hypothetical protein
MLKKVLLLIILLGLGQSAFADPSWVSIAMSPEGQKPAVEVLSSNNHETIIQFTLPGFIVEEDARDGEIFHILRCPGHYTTLEIGKPQIPAISEMVAIPPTTMDVTVSVIDRKETELTGYRVYPFQTPTRDGQESTEFDIDQGVYGQDQFYPDIMTELDNFGIWRNLRVANLRVYPIQYNPKTGTLKVYEKLVVKLEYQGSSYNDVPLLQNRPVCSQWDKMYQNTILNYDHLGLIVEENIPYGEEANTRQGYDFLIIAIDRFADELQALKNWKDSRGLATEIVLFSTIPGLGDPPAIRAYITQEYNLEGIEYVLLVGDESELPCFGGYFDHSSNPEAFISDYYYTLVDGADNYADIGVGRFSSTSEADIINMVNKSISYDDPSPPIDCDWYDKALLVTHLEGAPGQYQACTENIRTGIYSQLQPEFTTAYGSSFADGGDEASNADVIAFIDEGFRVVNYRGHGDNPEWWDWNIHGEAFGQPEINALNNGDLTPVVFSICCCTNALDDFSQCLGEMFTRPVDGAAAHLGAPVPSWRSSNNTYDETLFESIYDQGISIISMASNMAAAEVINNHGNFGLDVARMYLWLGDPTLDIFYRPVQTCPPDYGWALAASDAEPLFSIVGNAIAHDRNGGRTILFTMNGETRSWDGTQWAQLSPQNSPPAGHAQEMVCDFRNDIIVMFGGMAFSGGAFLDGTWLFDLSTEEWEKITNPSPTPRIGHAMVYDFWRRKVYLFGGVDQFGVPLLGTFEFDVTTQTWSACSPHGGVSPDPRKDHAMAYDLSSSFTILYGGFTYPAGGNAETWRWNGDRWELLSPSNDPGPRAGHGMIFNETSGNIQLFGGYWAGNTGLWEFDMGSTNWSQVATNDISLRAHMGMVFDATHRNTVLVDRQLNETETWVWPGVTRSFMTTGESDGIGWSWRITGTNFNIQDLCVEPVPSQQDAGIEFAERFVETINAASLEAGCPGGLTAEIWPWTGYENCFFVNAGGGENFEFCLGPYGGPADDCVTPTHSVQFNPLVGELSFGAMDRNANGIPDSLDIVSGTSLDENGNGIPDECEASYPKIMIEKTHRTFQGHFEFVSITLEDYILEMGGFDFLIAYDASALTFMEATPGQLLEDCDWEYFTYRHGVQGNCGDACPSGLLRIIAIAETNDGANHPSCFGPPDNDPYELAEMKFLVTNDRTFECQYAPIKFFWDDCGDNAVSSVDGEVLYVSDHIYEFDGTDITDPTYGFPTYYGVQSECLENPDPDKPIPFQLIDFVNGGIDIICDHEYDDRGDINLNGVPNEIADATVFVNYFVYGTAAFIVNVEGQIMATDVNADGIVLSVADLTYLIRIIVGDALPYPKLAPVEAEYAIADGVLSVNYELGAAHMVIKGKADPINLTSNMEMKTNYISESNETHVLLYSMEKGQAFEGDFLKFDGILLEIEAATYEGATVKFTSDLLPKEFVLHQNRPNPFNPITGISFSLPMASEVTLEIYNINGQKVATAAQDYFEAGTHTVEWDGTNYASGVYLYKITAGDFTDTKKMLLLK